MNPGIHRLLIERVVAELKESVIKLSGEDSPLANTWEDIKEAVQHGPSFFRQIYSQDMYRMIGRQVAQLNDEELADCMVAVKVADRDQLINSLWRRLVLRARKERIQYEPFWFQYFRHNSFSFTVYAVILRRTGMTTCEVQAYSDAARNGERGALDLSAHDDTLIALTKEEFELARTEGWP